MRIVASVPNSLLTYVFVCVCVCVFCCVGCGLATGRLPVQGVLEISSQKFQKREERQALGRIAPRADT